MWSMMGRKFRCEIRDAWLLIAISPLEEEALWDLFFCCCCCFICLFVFTKCNHSETLSPPPSASFNLYTK